MAKITFDTSNYPMVIAKFPSNATEEECKQYSVDLAEILRNRTGILLLVDARNVGLAAAGKDFRTAFANGFNEIEDLFNKSVVARAHVLSNKVIEGAFTAFSWMLKSKLTSPCKRFTDYDEAVKWLNSMKK